MFNWFLKKKPQNPMIKWNNRDMASLSSSHLKNIIRWIDREKLSSNALYKLEGDYNKIFCYLYIAAWLSYKSAARKLVNKREADLTLESRIIKSFSKIDESKFRK